MSKRTNSDRKAMKVQVVEEKSEEETDEEEDNLVKFQKRTILKGRRIRDVEEEEMVLLLEKLEL